MNFLKNLFKKKEKIVLTPEEEAAIAEVNEYGRVLTGNEDMCEYCKFPIFRDTEKWTKLQGRYFHRKCWKEGVKNDKTFG